MTSRFVNMCTEERTNEPEQEVMLPPSGRGSQPVFILGRLREPLVCITVFNSLLSIRSQPGNDLTNQSTYVYLIQDYACIPDIV